MGREPHTAHDFFELAALFRRSAETCDQREIQAQMHAAAQELEARARKIAGENSFQGKAARDPFARIDLLV